jgi:hypothetical protein
MTGVARRQHGVTVHTMLCLSRDRLVLPYNRYRKGPLRVKFVFNFWLHSVQSYMYARNIVYVVRGKLGHSQNANSMLLLRSTTRRHSPFSSDDSHLNVILK